MRAWQPAFSIGVLATALFTTLPRTLRAPNDWSEAQWLLDYRFGFVKRGLAGQLLQWLCGLFGQPVGEAAITAAAYSLLFVFALALLGVAILIVRAADWRAGPLAATTAFLCSPFVVMTAHLNGYLEHLFLPLGLASVWLVRRGWLLGGAMLQVMALLVHESSVVLVLPLFVLAQLVRAARTPPTERPPSAWLPLLLPLAMAGVMAFVVGAPPPDFVARYAAWLGEHPFVGGGFATITPDLLAWPLDRFWALVAPKYGERMAAPGSFGLVLPTVLVLLWLLLQRTAIATGSLLAVALGVVVLAPQGMHLVAFDLERIWTFSLFTTFVAVWVLSDETPPAGASAPPARGLLAASLLVIVANYTMETPLLDHRFDEMPRALRALVMLVLCAMLVVMGLVQEPGTLRERWRLRGRSLLDLLRRR